MKKDELIELLELKNELNKVVDNNYIYDDTYDNNYIENEYFLINIDKKVIKVIDKSNFNYLLDIYYKNIELNIMINIIKDL